MPLKISFPNIFALSQKKEALIVDCWDDENKTWNLGLRRSLFNREFQSWVAFVEKLHAVNLGNEVYKILWSLERSGVYTCKSPSESLQLKVAR